MEELLLLCAIWLNPMAAAGAFVFATVGNGMSSKLFAAGANVDIKNSY
jgi:hypothetical protein